jgi:hypothetical protein
MTAPPPLPLQPWERWGGGINTGGVTRGEGRGGILDDYVGGGALFIRDEKRFHPISMVDLAGFSLPMLPGRFLVLRCREGFSPA